MTKTVALLRDLPGERRISMERFADELATALRSATEWEPRCYRPEFRLPLPGTLADRVRRFGVYPLAVRRLDADVHHLIDHGYGDLALALAPERTVATCHDLMLLRAAETRRPSGRLRLTTARFRFSVSQLRRVAHVACVSEATRADVIRRLGVLPERTSVIPPGVADWFCPPDEPIEALRSRLGLHGRLVLHIDSGAGAYKNVEATLSVVAALRGRGIEATLIRAGSPLAADLRHAAPPVAVRDLGPVPEARLVELYQAADVLLFPSHHEGFGWPAAEAMACGTPVVASTAPALIETVGDAGLLCDARDIRGLTAAVLRVLDDDALAADLRARGLRRAAHFRWERTARAYAELYSRVAAHAAGACG